jgi:hypothetical protein
MSASTNGRTDKSFYLVEMISKDARTFMEGISVESVTEEKGWNN